MWRLLVLSLLAAISPIGLRAQTPVSVCPQAANLSFWVGLGASGCSYGTLTYSNFSYTFNQQLNVPTSPSPVGSFGISENAPTPGLDLDAPVETNGDATMYFVQQQTFTLTFDVAPNNGGELDGFGLTLGGLAGDASASASITGGGTLAASCSNWAYGSGWYCPSESNGCFECSIAPLDETFAPVPSATVSVAESAAVQFDQGAWVGPLSLSFDQTTPMVTPEPATWLLFGSGLVLLGLAARRRQTMGPLAAIPRKK